MPPASDMCPYIAAALRDSCRLLYCAVVDTCFSMIAETGRRAMSQKRKRQQDANFGAQEVIQHRSLARKEARDREVEAKRSRQERENERKDDANRRKDEIRILELQIELKDGGTGPGV